MQRFANIHTLENAENLIEENPDSTKILLTQAKSQIANNEFNKNLFSLLEFQYKVKKDSVIQKYTGIDSITDFFARKNDYKHAAKAYFYSAYIANQLSKPLDATYRLEQALDYASSISDFLIMARSNEFYGDIYSAIFDFSNAAMAYEKARTNYKKAGKAENELFSSADYAHCIGQSNPEKAIEYLDSIIAIASTISNRKSNVKIHRNKWRSNI